jgi:HlyD family secretion protein
MSVLSSFLRYVKKLPLLYWGGVVVVLVGAFLFLRPTETRKNIITIEPKPFIQQVSVSGKVTPSQEVDLGFSQGGRIASVYAKVGTRVSVGTTLAVVENGDLRAALLQRQAALENQEARLAALKAGTRPEEVAIAQSDVMRDTQALIDEMGDAYRAAEAAVHNTLDQFISNPRTSPNLNFLVTDSQYESALESKRLSAEAMLAAWGSEIAALNTAVDPSASVSRAQSNLASVVSMLSDASAAINRGIPNSQTPQATLDEYSAAVATARTNVNASVAALSSAVAALDSSKKTLALKAAGATVQDIAAQEAQVRAAQADVVAAQAQLSKTIISAPFSGVVTVVDAKVGKIVSPNTPEISMISTGAFQIESYVPEINVALIKVGDTALVTLDAYGDVPFEAAVVSLDPAETVRDGVSTYRAMLQFVTSDARIKSGMTATVNITTDKKDAALSLPQGYIIYRNNKAFVRMLDAGVESEREVSLGGVSSLGEVEILSGVSAGDQIVAEIP